MDSKALSSKSGKRLQLKTCAFKKQLKEINKLRASCNLVLLKIVNRKCSKCLKPFQTIDGYNKTFNCGCISESQIRTDIDLP
jgi:hypothetical protein